MLNQYEFGVNLGYLFLNMTEKNYNRAFVSEKIAEGKMEYISKKESHLSIPKE